MSAQDDDSPAVDSRDGADSLSAVREDLPVAAAAAGSAVALTIALEYGVDRSAPVLARMAPLFVYFLYLLVSKRDIEGTAGAPRTWIGLSAAVAVATFLYYAV